MRFGRVDTLGQYISEFDPEPDTGKKGIGIHRSLSLALFLSVVYLLLLFTYVLLFFHSNFQVGFNRSYNGHWVKTGHNIMLHIFGNKKNVNMARSANNRGDPV